MLLTVLKCTKQKQKQAKKKNNEKSDSDGESFLPEIEPRIFMENFPTYPER